MADLEPRLKKLGWWGQQEIFDPEAKRLVQVSIGPRRLRTIFETNLRTATAAGDWERITRQQHNRPYLEYVATLDNRTRDQHRHWDGIILPVDHEFWKTHYPPNGWGCRCTVLQWSEKDLKQRGLKVSPDPHIQRQPWVNKRTGEEQQVPVGIDPGWDHNVGQIGKHGRLEQANRILQNKTRKARPEVAAAVAGSKRFAMDYVVQGDKVLEELRRVAPDRRVKTFNEMLRQQHGNHQNTPNVVLTDPDPPIQGDLESRDFLLAGIALFPRPWVEIGNRRRVSVGAPVYNPDYNPKTGEMEVAHRLDSGVHEYGHHLWFAMPEDFRQLIRDLYIARTTYDDGTRHPVVQLEDYEKGIVGRPTNFPERYMSRVYTEHGDEPMELAPVLFQIVLTGRYQGEKAFENLEKNDPELLKFGLGLLMHYKP